MKERPIIFSTEMVRAILDSRKTQTRRVVKPQPIKQNGIWVWNKTAWDEGSIQISDLSPLDKCPYGTIGDRLWVRETWGDKTDFGLAYKADQPPDSPYHHGGIVWKPSIHMPRWASRITLEITDVRVERVQEISYKDLCSEGYKAYGLSEKSEELPALIWFQELWDSLNAKRGYSWESNPWVWGIEFKSITTITT